MAAAKATSLASIKARLQKGALTKQDIRRLESVVRDVEKAAKSLRAAIIE